MNPHDAAVAAIRAFNALEAATRRADTVCRAVDRGERSLDDFQAAIRARREASTLYRTTRNALTRVLSGKS